MHLKKKKAFLSLKSKADCGVLRSVWYRYKVAKVLYPACLRLR